MEKIEIIYAFNGYADPGIKNVELSRVNGYRTVIMKEGEEKMVTEYKLKNIDSSDVKRILELVDQKDIDIEDILSFLKKFIEKGKGGKSEMTNQTDDEKRFTAEEKKVTKYLEDHKGENLTYRDAVLACLDRSEKSEESQERKEEFAEYQEKQRKDLLAVDEYLEKHPNCSYRDAVKIVLCKVELSKPEILVEEYIESHNCSYKEAVLAVLDTTGKPKKE